MRLLLITCLALSLISCANLNSNRDNFLKSEQTQLQLRQMQSRNFDTADFLQVQRAVISTLQDLGFVMNRVDAELGVASATKLDGYNLEMTVTTKRSAQAKSMNVRANARYQTTTITDPLFYQKFFNSLQKSLFLTAHQVD